MIELESWVIMDKGKKAIACGSPRDRQMRLIESLKSKPVRILMYGTRSKALEAFSGGLGFYDYTDGYLKQTYPTDGWRLQDYQDICIPVKVKLVFDE